MFYTTHKSPLGVLTLASDNTHLRELHIAGDRYFEKIPDNWTLAPDKGVLQQAIKQLDEYFDGQRRQFSVPATFEGTPFQRLIWQKLQAIPYGHTISYGELAASIGRPQAVRAAGTAVGRNPLCLIVPCHRVLTGAGGLGGYVAGLERKRNLLALEQGNIA